MITKDHDDTPEWPPTDGLEYLGGDGFATLLTGIVDAFMNQYLLMDFSDAVATTIVWFEKRLAKEPDFISARRFPSLGAFGAYVKQAVWNAARAAERRRRASGKLDVPRLSDRMVSDEVSAESLAAFHEGLERLDPLVRRVFEIMHDSDDPPGGITRDAWAASALELDAEEIEDMYRRACTILYESLTGRRPERPRRRKKRR